MVHMFTLAWCNWSELTSSWEIAPLHPALCEASTPWSAGNISKHFAHNNPRHVTRCGRDSGLKAATSYGVAQTPQPSPATAIHCMPSSLRLGTMGCLAHAIYHPRCAFCAYKGSAPVIGCTHICYSNCANKTRDVHLLNAVWFQRFPCAQLVFVHICCMMGLTLAQLLLRSCLRIHEYHVSNAKQPCPVQRCKVGPLDGALTDGACAFTTGGGQELRNLTSRSECILARTSRAAPHNKKSQRDAALLLGHSAQHNAPPSDPSLPWLCLRPLTLYVQDVNPRWFLQH